MTLPVHVEDPGGRREVEPDEFPLALGGSKADIAVAGYAGSGPAAWLGLEADTLFLQAAGGLEPVACNGTRVSTSQWLRPGDVIRVGSTRIVVEADEPGIKLGVSEVEDEITEPPQPANEVGEGGGTEQMRAIRVRPVEFKPQKGPPGRRRRVRPRALLGWSAMLLLLVAAWWVFGLRRVEVVVEPTPGSFALHGGLFNRAVGEAHLLRPGTYVVTATLEGYHPLEERFEVTGESKQRFRFDMQKLPGRLEIDAGGVEDAEVRIDGKLVGRTPLEAVEVEPGMREVEVRAERRATFREQVEIEGGGATQAIRIEWLELWAPVTVRTEPAGAQVRVDGKVVGRSPLTQDLGSGAHTVDLHLAGYKPRQVRIDVVAEKPATVGPLRLEPSDGRVRLVSDPPGATVSVDGRYRGRTPLELSLRSLARHEIVVNRAGYGTETRQVELKPDERMELAVALAPDEGEVRITATPSDAELFVNGEPRGAAEQTLRLVAVPHEIEIRREGFEPFRATVTPRPGFPQSIRAALKTREQIREERIPPRIRTSQGQELVLIEGGRFMMGASRREPGRRANEALRAVEITRAYYLADQEVSNRQFHEFFPTHRSGRVGAHNLEIDHHPVVRVTWDEAAAYCNWLSARESLPLAYRKDGDRMVPVRPLTTGYRLPTEAEWAWAARYGGGEKPLKYPWGQALPIPPDAGNYADVSSADLLASELDGYDDRFAATAPVNSFSPNARGLFNMGGNVAEWVHDLYSVHLPDSSDVAIDPAGPEDGTMHVMRGSSWMDSSVTELRLTYRDSGIEARADLGFRIARYAETAAGEDPPQTASEGPATPAAPGG